MLESRGAEIVRMEAEKAVGADLSFFDRHCVLMPEKILDAWLRGKLEEENAKGKRIFAGFLVQGVRYGLKRGLCGAS